MNYRTLYYQEVNQNNYYLLYLLFLFHCKLDHFINLIRFIFSFHIDLKYD